MGESSYILPFITVNFWVNFSFLILKIWIKEKDLGKNRSNIEHFWIFFKQRHTIRPELGQGLKSVHCPEAMIYVGSIYIFDRIFLKLQKMVLVWILVSYILSKGLDCSMAHRVRKFLIDLVCNNKAQFVNTK